MTSQSKVIFSSWKIFTVLWKGKDFDVRYAKGQLISKRLLEKIIWTKIATKKFDNFCPGGQIKKIKTLFTLNTP